MSQVENSFGAFLADLNPQGKWSNTKHPEVVATVAVESLRKLADELCLPVPTTFEAMPRTELDDVRVLCWAAITSSREGES